MATSQMPQRPATFQVNKVWIKNFRSISDASLDLGRLTVLLGPNASGKSNLLDVLRFIKDTLRFDLETAISMRHGLGAVIHHDSRANNASIEITLTGIVRSPNIDTLFSLEYGFAITMTDEGQYSVSHEYGKIWDRDNIDSTTEFRIEHGNLVYPMSLAPTSRQQSFFDDRDDNTDFDRTDLAFPAVLRMIRRFTVTREARDDRSARLLYDGLAYLHRSLLNMRFYHIFPNTIREPQKLGNTSVLDEDAGNLASVLREMSRQRLSAMNSLKRSLERLIPGVLDIEVTLVGGYLVVRLKHDVRRGSSWYDLSQESDGTIRLLGLLAALYQPQPVPLMGVEEPELTVHPGALAVLSDILNEASKRSQILITTHSPDFIDCVTDHREVDSLRIVELVEGVTTVRTVAEPHLEAVKMHLFSPGELHRMGAFIS